MPALITLTNTALHTCSSTRLTAGHTVRPIRVCFPLLSPLPFQENLYFSSLSVFLPFLRKVYLNSPFEKEFEILEFQAGCVPSAIEPHSPLHLLSCPSACLIIPSCICSSFLKCLPSFKMAQDPVSPRTAL